ncbi:GerMN domain-containing protein [Hamadaea sp. NPDC051192]|uniref:GerMN domain-containing protein n=1 Tax=Hamadaea sp. NPDC051192 TaxID=3154940 RepID=UPI00344775BE
MRVLAASLGLALLAGCTAPAPTPSGSPSASTAASALASAGGSGLLPVYYTLSDRGTPKLVREFHRLAVAADTPAGKTTAAVAEMLRPSALDPDYHTLWPAGVRVTGSSVDGDVVTVDLTGLTSGVGAEAEGQAVQQLVWTATANSGASRVRIRVDGATVETVFGHISVKDPVRRAEAVDTLHLVWVISPQQGETVGRDVTLHLAGIVFENTLNYEILRDGKVVQHEVVTLEPGHPAMGEKKVTVRLSPGSYVVRAYEISMADSSRQHVDNHTFTVS